jgi:hypothetical protein
MSGKIIIEPHRITQFQPLIYPNFCFITSPEYNELFDIYNNPNYYNYNAKLVIQPHEDLSHFIATNTLDNCDILLLIPNAFALGYKNPHACLPKGSLSKRRMVALRCLSTPASKEDISLIVKALYDIPIDRQMKLVDRLYELGESAEYLEIQDSKEHSYARFDHLSDDYTWHSLYGTPSPGQFVLAPSGETNVIVTKMENSRENQVSLDINGTIILHGVPIVHHGMELNCERKQAQIFNDLNALRFAPVKATVKKGEIIDVNPLDPAANAASNRLKKLFQEDERYRLILELGFGLNENLSISKGNLGTNEFYGGQGGCIHYGLGRVPHTKFHIDIVCPNARLVTSEGERIFGPLVEQ